jgi:cell division septal protein FtsQ
MRISQSLAQLERAFLEHTEEHRHRREQVLRQAELRARRRQLERTHKRGSLRYALLVLVLIATAVLVTVAMFETLYLVMG